MDMEGGSVPAHYQADSPCIPCRGTLRCIVAFAFRASRCFTQNTRSDGSGHRFIGFWTCNFLLRRQAKDLGRWAWAVWMGKGKEPGWGAAGIRVLPPVSPRPNCMGSIASQSCGGMLCRGRAWVLRAGPSHASGPDSALVRGGGGGLRAGLNLGGL